MSRRRQQQRPAPESNGRDCPRCQALLYWNETDLWCPVCGWTAKR